MRSRLEQAGCVLLVEAVPPEVADRIAASTTGTADRDRRIGTGCHGQVLVLQDLVGMTDQPPRFAGRSRWVRGFSRRAEVVARVAA